MRSIIRPVVTIVAVFGLVLGLLAPAAARDEHEQADRIPGEGRVDTAANTATRTFSSATEAVIARAGAWPDALSGSALAGAVDGPVLLVWRDRLPQRTIDALEALGVQRTFLLGGPNAISQDVEARLDERGYDTPRIAGQTRYETSADVARQVHERVGIGAIDGQPAVFVATGADFADALAVGGGAFRNHDPVVLTTTDELHPAARQAIRDVGAQRAVLAGGDAALSDQVRHDLEEMGVATVRLGGRDRTDTAQIVASWLIDHLGFDPNLTLLSRGDAFPDALAAAPHGGRNAAPLILSRTPTVMSYDTLQWLVDHADEQQGATDIETVRALGGLNAVSAPVLDRAAETAAPPEAIHTYSVEADGQGISAEELAWFSEHTDWTLVDQRGWALGNDVRWDGVDDPGTADINVHLATPEQVAAADESCSPEWSCQPAGTNDVYINVEEWRDTPPAWDGRPIGDYRHYVVLHEFGHAPPMDFGHIRCDEYHADPDGDPAPVMEQQSQGDGIGPDQCRLNVWPLQGELERARDALIGTGSTAGSSSTERTVEHQQP